MELWHEVIGGSGGTTILAMHGGLGFDHTYMKRSFTRLADGDRRVVVYDHRGNGRSVPADRASITMESLADDAAGLLDDLAVDRAIVLGHSYGGFVAQEFALRHPDRLAGLALVSTTPGQLGATENADAHEQGPPIPDDMATLMSAIPTSDDEFAAGVPATLAFYLHHRDPHTQRRMTDLIAGTIYRVDAMLRGFEILPSWSSVDRLHTIDAPTIVIVGRHDLPTSWPQSKRIASRVPDAELAILEDSGHFPWVEEPEAFFGVLESWLGRQTRR